MKACFLLCLLPLLLSGCSVSDFGWEDASPAYNPSPAEIAAQARYNKLEKQKDALARQADRLEAEMDITTDPKRAAEILDEENVLALGMDQLQREQLDCSATELAGPVANVQKATRDLGK